MKIIYALIFTFLSYPVFSSEILSSEEVDSYQLENTNLVYYANPTPLTVSSRRVEADIHDIYQNIEGITDDCLRCGIYTWTIGGNLASVGTTIFTAVATVGIAASTTGWIPAEWDIYVKGGATLFGTLATIMSVIDESSEKKVKKLKEQLILYLKEHGVNIVAISEDV